MGDEIEVGPVVKVTQLLREILRLHGELHAQAVADGDNPDIPGGAAMVALGPVANLEAWENHMQATERFAEHEDERLRRVYTSAIDEDPEVAWSAYQTLEFWSEAWRRERGHDYDMQRDVGTEVKYLLRSLAWAWDNELGWDDFVSDVKTAKSKLEGLLSEGLRSTGGAPCLSCGTTLIRPAVKPKVPRECSGDADGVCAWPHRHCAEHDRGGLRDHWKCPNDECARWYPVTDYTRAIANVAFAYADWLTLEDAVERTGAKGGSIKVWAHRGKVRRRKDQESGRVMYHIEDITEAHRGSLAQGA